MSGLLVGATALFALVAIIMTIVAAKLIRESRARSAARIETLRAIVSEPPDMPAARSLAMARPVDVELPRLPAVTELADDVWDFDLHEPEFDEGPAPVARAAAALREPAPRASEVRTSTFELRSSSHDLFEDPVERTPSRRWGWMAAAGVAMACIAGVIYVASSGVLGRLAASGGAAKSAASSSSPIELLSLRHATEAGQFVVTGLVQNPPASVTHRGVQAVVYLFDQEGRYFATSRAALESAVLSPGGEAAFVVRVPASADVSKYRVSFQHEDGAAVIHVDRRGTLPENTSGDAVASTPAAPIVNARKSG